MTHNRYVILTHTMRRGLLILLLVLLPLRAVMTDAMAIQMMGPVPASPAGATDSIAASAAFAGAIDTFDKSGAQTSHAQTLPAPAPMMDCPGHAAANQSSQPDTPTPAWADCGSCSACQLCHLSALATVTALVNVPPLRQASPASPATRYLSADRAPGFKPPIS